MDANSKLGKDIIKGDPKEQSKNGKLLEEVINDNDLVVVNGTSVCEGVITRHRQTVNGIEESVLDYFIVCRSFFNLIIKMTVDQERKFSLSSYSKRNGTVNIKKSDHNLLYLEVKKCWKSSVKNNREEIYNFNDEEGFDRFAERTVENDALKHCFDDECEDIEVSSNRWLKIVNGLIRKSFKKIRIGKHKTNPALDKLFQKKEFLMKSLSVLEQKEDFKGAEEARDNSRQCC